MIKVIMIVVINEQAVPEGEGVVRVPAVRRGVHQGRHHGASPGHSPCRYASLASPSTALLVYCSSRFVCLFFLFGEIDSSVSVHIYEIFAIDFRGIIY